MSDVRLRRPRKDLVATSVTDGTEALANGNHDNERVDDC